MIGAWRRCGAWFVLLAGIGTGCTAGPAADPIRTAVDPAERLFVAVFALDHTIDRMYQEETQRLLGLCGSYDADCFARHFVSVRRAVSLVRSAPDTTAAVLGRIDAVVKLPDQPHGGLRIDLEFEPVDAPGQAVVWRRTGDWGYGIYVAGVRPQGHAVQVFDEPLPAQSWIPLGEPALSGSVMSIAGQIMQLDSVRAGSADGSLHTVADGSYVILGVSDGVVELRGEIESDMPCGLAAVDSVRRPPILRTTPADLFTANGTPRFAVRYQRGC